MFRIVRSNSLNAGRLLGQAVYRRTNSIHATRHLHQTHVTRDMPDLENHPTLQKLRSNPRVMKVMVEAMQLLQSKNFIEPGSTKPPSFMKMMQMMQDPEVKQKFMEMQELLKKEGISFSPSDLSAFMGFGNSMGGSQEAGKELGDGSKSLFNRVADKLRSK